MSEKKVMLSSPMKGKTDEEIKNERKDMIELLLLKYENVVVIDSVIKNYKEKSELECFSESIFHMSQCDALVMGYDWENARGCRLEHEIAKAYGLPIIYLTELDGGS